jgi:nicotinamidase-related amidase
MNNTKSVTLTLRRQVLVQDADGRNIWQVSEERRALPCVETALLLCDVWDRHWSKGAVIRLNALVPGLNNLVKRARERGIFVIHAPSGVLEVYEHTPARKRIAEVARVHVPTEIDHPDPPLPFITTEGSDTNHGDESPNTRVWTCQHPGIEIDQEKDGISDKGKEIYNFMRSRDISNLIVTGVHTNMCVLARSFGIKQMVKWGVNVMLCRDMTDAMYNPGDPPYVSHEEGTRLVVEYIEKFWCPTVSSEDI